MSLQAALSAPIPTLPGTAAVFRLDGRSYRPMNGMGVA